MHDQLNKIPQRAEWKQTSLFFSDHPEEQFVLRWRDIIDAIQALWSEPGLAEHFVYAPRKVWKDIRRKTRHFNEMWTGLWWEAMQVCLCSTKTMHYTAGAKMTLGAHRKRSYRRSYNYIYRQDSPYPTHRRKNRLSDILNPWEHTKISSTQTLHARLYPSRVFASGESRSARAYPGRTEVSKSAHLP